LQAIDAAVDVAAAARRFVRSFNEAHYQGKASFRSLEIGIRSYEKQEKKTLSEGAQLILVHRTAVTGL
jgi:hypothetical protein